MKKTLVLIAGILFLMAGVCQAEQLSWTVPISGGVPDGYIVYYTDQTNNYNYDVGNQLICETDVLNLAFGVEYAFHVTAYNAAGESGASNIAIWIDEAYVPPIDVLPPIVIEISGPVTITIGP